MAGVWVWWGGVRGGVGALVCEMVVRGGWEKRPGTRNQGTSLNH